VGVGVGVWANEELAVTKKKRAANSGAQKFDLSFLICHLPFVIFNFLDS